MIETSEQSPSQQLIELAKRSGRIIASVEGVVDECPYLEGMTNDKYALVIFGKSASAEARRIFPRSRLRCIQADNVGATIRHTIYCVNEVRIGFIENISPPLEELLNFDPVSITEADLAELDMRHFEQRYCKMALFFNE